METTSVRLFELTPCGDPHTRGWDVREYQDSFDEPTCTYRGDLSPLTCSAAMARVFLKRHYPGCRVRVSR